MTLSEPRFPMSRLVFSRPCFCFFSAFAARWYVDAAAKATVNWEDASRLAYILKTPARDEIWLRGDYRPL